MQTFFEEYGKIIITVLVSLVVLGVLFGGFYVFWFRSADIDGGVTSSRLDYSTLKEGQPTLIVEDRQVKSGESFDVLTGVSAYDNEDGDLTGQITVKELTGNRLKKVGGQYLLDTTIKGSSYLEYRVKNTKGLQTKLRVCIMID